MAVLHLEDDGPLSDIFRLFFKNSAPNITLYQFSNSTDAIEFIKEHLDEIKVYILDMRVPGEVDGIGVARKIRELGSKRPIIIMSAFRQPPQEVLNEFDGTWMSKPSHLLNMMQKIIPLAKAE